MYIEATITNSHSFDFLFDPLECLENSGEFETEAAAERSWAFLEAASLRMCFNLSCCMVQ